MDLDDYITSVSEIHEAIIAEVNVRGVFGCGNVAMGLINNNKEQ